MKIFILSTSHPYKAAGVVALDIYKGLKEIRGDEVKLVVKKWDNYSEKDIIPIDTFFSLTKARIVRKLSKILIELKIINKKKIKTNPDYNILDYDQTITYYSTKKLLKKAGFNPDVNIVLFMHNFLSFKNLYELYKATNAPILLYMMDMASITGGCHYAWDCKNYTKQCGNCPGLYSSVPNDQSHLNWKFKKKYIDKTEIIPISCTEWQFRQLQESSLFNKKEKYKILLPIDDEVLKPANKEEVRKRLNLPISKKIVFFGAVTVNERRKGFKELIEALRILKSKLRHNEISNIHLVVAGNSNEDIKDILPFDHTFLGYLSHDKLAAAFQASDVFVSPSIEDSGPMMINQSIMCGTPVVSFEMGVAEDLVHNFKTGYRAKLKDSEDLAKGLFTILNLSDQDYNLLSSNCRDYAMETFSTNVQMGKFNKLIQTLNYDN